MGKDKILGADKNEYLDSKTVGTDKCYYYKIIAKYRDPECYSPPAKAKYSDDFFVVACNSTNVEENASHDFVAYPNPAKDIVKLSAISGQLSVVKIYNMMGMLIEKFEFSSDEVKIDVSDYNSGIYFFNVDGETFKIIKN